MRLTVVPSPVTDLTTVTGAYPLAIDDDEHVDLVVLRVGEDVILRGSATVASSAPTKRSPSTGETRGRSPSVPTWEGANELPTLAFGDYLEVDREGCEDSRLLRPDGDKGGYAPTVALSPGYCTLSVLFSDWNRSGQRDLRMTNDRHYYRDGSDQLWRVRSPTRRRGSTPRPRAGDGCRSGGWASPVPTSPATATPRCT